MPFKSKAQQRFMFAAEKRGDVPKGTAGEWARASEKKPGGIKALPEKVKKTAGEMADGALSAKKSGGPKPLPDNIKLWLASEVLKQNKTNAPKTAEDWMDFATLKKVPASKNLRRAGIGAAALGAAGLGAYGLHQALKKPGGIKALPEKVKKTAGEMAESVVKVADTDKIKLDEVKLDEVKLDKVKLDKIKLDTFEPDRFEPRRFEPKRFEPKTVNPEALADEARTVFSRIGENAPKSKFLRNAGIGAAALGAAGLGGYGLYRALKKDEPKTAGDEPGASDNKSFISRHPNVTGLLGAAAGWKEDMMARLQRTMSGTGAQAEQNVKDIASQTAEVADEVVNDRVHPAAIGALASLPGPGWVAAPIVAGFGAPKGRGRRAVANTILGEIGGGIAGSLAGAALGHGVGRLSVLGKRFRVSPKELQKLDKIVKDDVFRRQYTADSASEAWNRSFEQGPLFPSSAGERPPTPRLWSSISASGEAAAAQHQMNQLKEVLARKSNRIGNVRGAGYLLGSMGGAGFGAGKGYDLATRDKPKEASALADTILTQKK